MLKVESKKLALSQVEVRKDNVPQCVILRFRFDILSAAAQDKPAGRVCLSTCLCVYLFPRLQLRCAVWTALRFDRNSGDAIGTFFCSGFRGGRGLLYSIHCPYEQEDDEGNNEKVNDGLDERPVLDDRVSNCERQFAKIDSSQ